MSDHQPLEPVLVPRESGALGLHLEDAERYRRVIDDETPASTRRARRQALAYWQAWHHAAYAQALPWPVPVAAVVRFVLDHADGLPESVERELVAHGVKRPGPHALATIEARCAHLSKAHRVASLPSPVTDPRVRELLTRLRHRRAKAGGQKRALALTLPRLDRLVVAALADAGPGSTEADRLRGLRDAALLLCAFDTAARRSEIVALTVEDLAPEAAGLLWTFRGPTKTDQAGEGFTLWLGPRAAEALDAWAAAAGLESGPVFRAVGRWGHVSDQALTGRQVARIYRHRAAAAGLEASRVSGHSPRAGLVTEAGRQGIPLQEVMQVSRHSDPRTALRYHRQGSARHNRAAGLAG